MSSQKACERYETLLRLKQWATKTLKPDVSEDVDIWPAKTVKRAGIVVVGVSIVAIFASLFVPMDEAVLAVGRVSVSGERQAVQHPQGGVAEVVFVHEGQHVAKGQTLVRLKREALEADLGATELRMAGLWSARERLIAQQAGQGAFAMPAGFEMIRSFKRKDAELILATERQRLSADLAATEMADAVIVQEIAQTEQSIESTRVQRQSLKTQIELIASELNDTQSLADRGYAPITRVRALKREEARLLGEYEGLKIEDGKNRHRILELRARKTGLWKDRAEALARERQSIESEIATLEPSLPAMRERHQMAEIRAPVSGKVVGLTLFTNGGVVPAGQTLMEIMPDGRPLLIDADVLPQDVESLMVGQKVEVRFASYQDRRLANVSGTLTNVSADALDDPKTDHPLFKIKIEIDLENVKSNLVASGMKGSIKAGMPVDVLIPVKPRTAFEYVTQPITGAFWKSFHEH